MACHEYGIIPEFDPDTGEYEEYRPEAYGCVAVEDDLAEQVMGKLEELDTFFHRGSRPAKGFAFCGVTLIPPGSLGEFLAAVQGEGNPELAPLEGKIREAVRRGKYMIHYGL